MGGNMQEDGTTKPVISPDYETAALLLQLQQDMLAYVDEEAAEPTVVIGAGVTPGLALATDGGVWPRASWWLH